MNKPQCNHKITVNGIIYYCFEEAGHMPPDFHSYYFNQHVPDYISTLEADVDDYKKALEYYRDVFRKNVEYWQNETGNIGIEPSIHTVITWLIENANTQNLQRLLAEKAQLTAEIISEKRKVEDLAAENLSLIEQLRAALNSK